MRPLQVRTRHRFLAHPLFRITCTENPTDPSPEVPLNFRGLKMHDRMYVKHLNFVHAKSTLLRLSHSPL